MSYCNKTCYFYHCYILGAAAKWNLENFRETDRARMFNDVSIETIEKAQADIRHLKSKVWSQYASKRVSKTKQMKG